MLITEEIAEVEDRLKRAKLEACSAQRAWNSGTLRGRQHAIAFERLSGAQTDVRRLENRLAFLRARAGR